MEPWSTLVISKQNYWTCVKRYTERYVANKREKARTIHNQN